MSSRGRKPPHALTPEESRYLDGRLPPKEARQLEHQLAADPERAAALDAYREAVGVWRDDAEHSADTVSADVITDRVLAAIESGEGARPRSLRASPTAWYAAAAVALIALGIAGTVISRSGRPGPHTQHRDFATIQSEVIESMISHAVLFKEGSR